jgi:hypothetical protein
MVALLAPVLIGFAALAVDVGRWLVEAERVQKTADAAANAGVIYMPQEFLTAQTAARQVAARNGYAHNPPATVVDVAPGPRRSQLKVTISSTVKNAFGTVFGFSQQVVTRSATADYSGPVPMGSPCNLFGNEPLGAAELTAGSATNCKDGSTPNFWANIAGPQTSKQNGDRYAAQGCTSASDSYCLGAGQVDNCDHFGSTSCQGEAVPAKPVYYFRLRIAPGAGNVDVQVFDPAFINVGDHCEKNLRPASSSNSQWGGSNTPNNVVTDARARYAYGDPTTSPASTGMFCTGDNQFGYTSNLPVTTYAVLGTTDTGDPANADPIGACTPRQWRGLDVDLTKYLDRSTTEGRSADGTYAQENFRRWQSLNCVLSAPATEAQDYYIEVRTNIRAGAVSNARMKDPKDDPGVTGSGHNRFALRAVASGNRDAVSLAGFERMPIYANFKSGTSTRFYLARVPSSAAGNVLQVQFFDTGDSTDTGTITMAAPSDNTGTNPIICYDSGFRPGASSSTVMAGCRLTNVRSDTGYQGKAKVVNIQIPVDYTCSDNVVSGCWFTIGYAYGSSTSGGGVQDTTTWSAFLDGDPVRLVK